MHDIVWSTQGNWATRLENFSGYGGREEIALQSEFTRLGSI